MPEARETALSAFQAAKRFRLLRLRLLLHFGIIMLLSLFLFLLPILLLVPLAHLS